MTNNTCLHCRHIILKDTDIDDSEYNVVENSPFVFFALSSGGCCSSTKALQLSIIGKHVVLAGPYL